MKKRSTLSVDNRFVFLGDLFITAATVLLAFSIRLEGEAVLRYSRSIYWMIGMGLLIKPLIYSFFGLYRRVWAYASINELRLITVSVSVGGAVIYAGMLALYMYRVINFPRAVLMIDWLLSIILIGGSRLILRMISEGRVSNVLTKAERSIRHVLIIGAGDAGALVVRELQKNPQLSTQPIGFLDDDPNKQHHKIYGVPVIGKLPDLRHVLETRPVDEVIIAIPSTGGNVVRMVADVCRLKGVPFRTMPGLYELIGGKVSVNRLREVDITDLLRREPAQIQETLISEVIKGKRILVTGAGGSIGRELCRQIARWKPEHLILLGHGENSIFEAMLELQNDHPDLRLTPVIADVRNLARLQAIFKDQRPQVVFHAAAHKHVPLMESNVEEAVTNNILGTRNVVQAASDHLVERLVMISTDKAIRPVNVMGATKRISEMIVLEAAHHTGRAYSVVRFGNVLGSRGSVVPRFKAQIARGGPVTVTHPEMKRYFMIIPEAVHLVLQAAAMGKGGEVFLLNMGQQVKIVDLAKDLIRLSGLEPNKDIEIIYTGIRPGEKLSEDLWEAGKSYGQTDHPDVFRVEEEEANLPATLDEQVERMNALAEEGKTEAILQLLGEMIPSAAVRSTQTDLNSVI